MRILTLDIGTGTQDIYLYDSRLHMENGFKLVVPAPTMIVRRRLQEATRRGEPVLLTGLTMGGGPSHWAAEDHLKAGYPVYATPDAARSFNDDLAVIREMGITVVGEDEAAGLPDEVVRLELRDFDFGAIARALAQFGIEPRRPGRRRRRRLRPRRRAPPASATASSASTTSASESRPTRA
jgi:uncharacterized protein (DUF1786 family)